MNELTAIVGGALLTLIGLAVWLIKYLVKKLVSVTENSIKAIENNTTAIKELKRIWGSDN